MDITGIGSIFDFLGKAADKIWPNADEANKAKLAMLQAQQAGELAGLAQEFELMKSQIEANAVQAASPNVFVSGPRPFIMWVCGIALAYVALLEPIARFVATVAFHYAGSFPVIDTTLTTQLLFALLGLGGMRTAEKFKGVASK